MINLIKRKMEEYRDSILIREDMLLAAKDDVERSVDYFYQCLENGDTVPHQLIFEKIDSLNDERAIINAELAKINRTMKGLFYKTINRFCYDASPYMYM